MPGVATVRAVRGPRAQRKLGDVVAVGGGQRDRRAGYLSPRRLRDACCQDGSGIDWRGACLFAPSFARTCELSTTARDQSICPELFCNWSKKHVVQALPYTRLRSHSCKRRQHVIPEPPNPSLGADAPTGSPSSKQRGSLSIRGPVRHPRTPRITRICGARTGKTGSIRRPQLVAHERLRHLRPILPREVDATAFAAATTGPCISVRRRSKGLSR